MKALFKKFPQSSFQYRNYPNGWKFIDTIDSDEQAFNIVAEREDQDFFPQDDGTVLCCSGGEVFNPNDPTRYYFGDFDYHVVDLAEINTVDDVDMILAIDIERPWNHKEITDAIPY